MITETTYQCEICGAKYERAADAMKCEERGRMDPDLFPVGLMYSYKDRYNDGREFDMVFAMAERSQENHILTGNFWAARDNHNGDNYGSERCSGGGGFIYKQTFVNNPITAEVEKSPAFRRMVDYLISEGIAPSFYNIDGELEYYSGSVLYEMMEKYYEIR